MATINRYYLVRVEFEATEEGELTQDALNMSYRFEDDFDNTFGYGNVKRLSSFNDDHVKSIKSAFKTDEI